MKGYSINHSASNISAAPFCGEIYGLLSLEGLGVEELHGVVDQVIRMHYLNCVLFFVPLNEVSSLFYEERLVLRLREACSNSQTIFFKNFLED